VESLGPRLKREREQRKISLDDISVSTKIAPRFLIAIEEEHFDQLPGGIFNKGFVRAYARHLGLDEAQAIADYVAASGAVLPENQPIEVLEPSVAEVPEPEAADPASRIPWEVLAIVLLVVAFGFALWGFHSREKSARPSLVPKPLPSENSAAPAASARETSPAAPAAPSTSTSPQPSAPPPSAAPSPPRAAAPDPGAFLVQVKARQDSWVVISADGKEIMQDTLRASAEKSIGARDQVVIRTGNAGALDISFNGKELPPQGSYNQVRTLTFDPNGLRPLGSRGSEGAPSDER